MSTILIIILLILIFGGGGGYYAHGRYGTTGLGGVLGIILIVLVVLWLVGDRHIRTAYVMRGDACFVVGSTLCETLDPLLPTARFQAQGRGAAGIMTDADRSGIRRRI